MIELMCDVISWYFSPYLEFIMAVFTASMSRDMSTHKFDYSFCCSSDREGYAYVRITQY